MTVRVTTTQKNEILYWHKHGKSQRKIALLVDVDRSTVKRIVETYQRAVTVTTSSTEIIFFTVPAYDCHGCKQRVTIRPCPYCEAVRYRERKHDERPDV